MESSIAIFMSALFPPNSSTMVQLNQASGILSLLDENSNELKVYALNKLNEIVGKRVMF